MSDAKNSETNLQYVYANLEASINKFNVDIKSSPWAAFKDLYQGFHITNQFITNDIKRTQMKKLSPQLTEKIDRYM